MLEPAELANLTAQQFKIETLTGQHVVITAGPTREPIDPVRYITNHSSGKMGYALAEAAVEAGAKVTLISGPVNLDTPERVARINVSSAQEMYEAAIKLAPQGDIFIATAAVADYTPIVVADQKIKKHPSSMTIELKPTIDIVASVAALENKPFTVGFAAETQHVIGYAQGKLAKKNLDMIIANDVSVRDIGFNSDDNAVIVISADRQVELAKASKRQLARSIIDLIAQQRAKEKTHYE
jgi:phosphopantothenoylcysteine decarboxylase/phosphopantothenate--cysteine ligase